MSKYFQSKLEKSIGLAIGIFAALITGFLIAVLPIGILVRLVAPLILATSLIVAWGFRTNKETTFEAVYFWIGLSIIAFSLIWPRYIFFGGAGLPSVNPYTISAIFGIYLSVILLIYSKYRWKLFIGAISYQSLIIKLCLLLLAWSLICSIFGEEPTYSTIELIKESIYLTSFILFGLMLITYNRGVELTLKSFVMFGFIIVMIGLVESFTYKNLFTQFATSGGSAETQKAVLAIVSDKSRDGGFRVQSVFGHPIVFAQFLSGLIPISFFLLMNERSIIWRTISALLIPAAIIAIVKSGSRSGYFSLAAAFSCMVFVWWCKALKQHNLSRAVAIIMLPAILIASFFLYFILSDLFAGRSAHEISSTNTRLTMLANGWAALKESPIIGYGYGMSVSKAGVITPAGIPTIDNYLLSISIDFGFVGLIIFCAILGFHTIKSINFSTSRNSTEASFVGACCASLLAFFVTFTGLSTNQNMTYYWTILIISLPALAGKKLFNFESDSKK